MTTRNLVSSIERRDPQALEILAKAYPHFRSSLRTGRDLGEVAKPSVSDTEAPLALLLTGLQSLRLDCEEALNQLSTRLRAARRLQLVGAIVSASASGGLLSLLSFKMGRQGVAIALASISLLSAIITIAADQLTGKGNARTVSKLFEQAAQISASIIRIQRKADRSESKQLSPDDCERLLDETDDLAFQMHALLVDLKVV